MSKDRFSLLDVARQTLGRDGEGFLRREGGAEPAINFRPLMDRLQVHTIEIIRQIASNLDRFPSIRQTEHIGEEHKDGSPNNTTRGFMVPVTREAVLFDRTKYFVARIKQVTNLLLTNKEKRLREFAGEDMIYLEKWPITVVQTRTNPGHDFTEDIIGSFKISELGRPAERSEQWAKTATG